MVPSRKTRSKSSIKKLEVSPLEVTKKPVPSLMKRVFHFNQCWSQRFGRYNLAPR